jgi:hypothetical protein
MVGAWVIITCDLRLRFEYGQGAPPVQRPPADDAAHLPLEGLDPARRRSIATMSDQDRTAPWPPAARHDPRPRASRVW